MRLDDGLRLRVWERDGGLCGICGASADPSEWQLDHIVPRALGGPDTEDNLRVSHPACNRRRRLPMVMTDEEITEAAAEWTANEFDLDRFATLEEFVSARGQRS